MISHACGGWWWLWDVTTKGNMPYRQLILIRPPLWLLTPFLYSDIVAFLYCSSIGQRCWWPVKGPQSTLETSIGLLDGYIEQDDIIRLSRICRPRKYMTLQMLWPILSSWREIKLFSRLSSRVLWLIHQSAVFMAIDKASLVGKLVLLLSCRTL